MSRRGENIRKRKDGRWEGRYKQFNLYDNKTKYCSVYGCTYAQCKQKLEKAKSENVHTISNSPDIYFKDILYNWLKENQIRLKKSTETKYYNMIETHIIPELGNIKINKISSQLLNVFLEDKLMNGRRDGKGGLSPSYVRTMAIILNASIKYAEHEGLCLPLKNPIHKPSVEKKKLNILSINTQKKLEEYILNNINFENLGVFIVLHTGLRLGEICALSWNDIDFINRTIHVRHTISRVRCLSNNNIKSKLIIDTAKTASSIREIPISSILFPILESMHKKSISEYVISSTNTFVSPRTYEYQYHKLLAENGVSKLTFHALRHTFATRCIEAGVDVKTLSELLGHSNVSTTLNIYVHPSLDIKRRQLEKMCALTH